MNQLHHPKLINLHDAFEDKYEMVLILELWVFPPSVLCRQMCFFRVCYYFDNSVIVPRSSADNSVFIWRGRALWIKKAGVHFVKSKTQTFPLFKTLRRFKYSFMCFACCQEFCLWKVCLLSSFIFIFLTILFRCRVMCIMHNKSDFLFDLMTSQLTGQRMSTRSQSLCGQPNRISSEIVLSTYAGNYRAVLSCFVVVVVCLFVCLFFTLKTNVSIHFPAFLEGSCLTALLLRTTRCRRRRWSTTCVRHVRDWNTCMRTALCIWTSRFVGLTKWLGS